MTLEEITKLKQEYFDKEGYTFPGDFEHRVDAVSSSMMYSLIRKLKPTSALEIGSWRGGSTVITLAALLKNETPFKYYCSEIADDLRADTELHCMQKFGQAPIMLGDITKSLEKLPKELDFLFVDTSHDEETTKWIVENIFPLMKKGSLIAIHDWAVYEEDGKWISKDGPWDETRYFMQMHEHGRFPFEKLFWTYKNPGSEEMGFFTYGKT